jgi:hypothetical protein
MTPALRQTLVLSVLALAAYFGLRSLPDSQCAFLHADHQPVVAQGVEFCGLNEEANFYSPKALRFPVKLELSFADSGRAGSLRLLGEGDRPILPYEIAVSHTQKLHLHLRQVTGRKGYIHLHPTPSDDGTWRFDLPAWFTEGNSGGEFQAYVDFVTLRSAQVQLAETTASLEVRHMPVPPLRSRNVVQAVTISTQQTGKSALVRVTLASPAGSPPLKLQPLMASLGHAVLFGDRTTQPGYAHMHPSLEGGEFEPNPTLSFRLRLPPPGKYDLWLNISDGAEDYLLVPIEVTP